MSELQAAKQWLEYLESDIAEGERLADEIIGYLIDARAERQAVIQQIGRLQLEEAVIYPSVIYP